jgi:hypothetical protein
MEAGKRQEQRVEERYRTSTLSMVQSSVPLRRRNVH